MIWAAFLYKSSSAFLALTQNGQRLVSHLYFLFNGVWMTEHLVASFQVFVT